MLFEEIKTVLEKEIPGAVTGEDLASSPPALIIDGSHLKSVCEILHTHDQLYFDSLSCLTGLDNGEEKNTMEVVYNLYSIPYELHLSLKVILDRSDPEVDSVSEIWRTADWHEREAYDLLGIKFKGHPDLRRILLPEDWEGHPLRKDYQEQEVYHDVKVKY
ncbi:NADH-quinone oxidoreductase subunit C [Ekhidna sp.]|uniref:NADH-quinone oxidoreductase subunit C n=1 Tax=Ekhidna sp. TaxID=2608089 RepID=UPI003CCB9900